MDPFLTILTVCPFELDSSYCKLYREALLNWNEEGLAETQIILLPQGPIESDVDPFEIVPVDFEQVEGYPVWDVMRSVRAAWPFVRGQYVSFDHPEFIWGPDRLVNTIAWLKGYRPLYALGNLRRAGCLEELTQPNSRDISEEPSKWFRAILEAGDWEAAIEPFEYLQTMHWMYWKSAFQRPGANLWIEDLFYLDREWCDIWGLARYQDELPFQDIWDLTQMIVRTFFQFGLPFDCVRMPMIINKTLHLWHPRSRANFSPAMRDWFLSQPERWSKSAFGDPALWDGLIDLWKDSKADNAPLVKARFGPRGTAINYGVFLSQWLANGGIEAIQRFAEERRERGLR